jgi:hypothetical protein
MKLFPLSFTTKRKPVTPPPNSYHICSGFDLNPEATSFMSSIEGPVGLVAVAGLYRTGKSYLLNRMLLNRSDGFGVGPTINPCTKVSLPIQTNFFKFRVFGFGGDLSRDSHLKASP